MEPDTVKVLIALGVGIFMGLPWGILIGSTELGEQEKPEKEEPGPSSIPCCKCGGPVIEFSVPNDAWNTIVRGDGAETAQEYLCIKCFANLAAGKITDYEATEAAKNK